VRRTKKTRRHLALPGMGRVAAAVINLTAGQDIADRGSTTERVRRGLAQAKKGAWRPVDEVFDDIERDGVLPLKRKRGEVK
jgi:hypothetical protein